MREGIVFRFADGWEGEPTGEPGTAGRSHFSSRSSFFSRASRVVPGWEAGAPAQCGGVIPIAVFVMLVAGKV